MTDNAVTSDLDLTDTENESEQQLVSRAQGAVSQCNWVVGACAARWTQRYARGRTDADFGQLVGLSGDQVFQRRRVWETFGDVYLEYPGLKWSHFYVALNWDDAPECLHWALENDATVAEMKAWRRAVRGEDLTEEPPPDSFAGDPAASLSLAESVVRSPSDVDDSLRESKSAREASNPQSGSQDGSRVETAYAPYRKDAGSVASGESSAATATAARPELPADQLLKRLAKTLERMTSALTPERLDEILELPGALRDPFLDALDELNAHVQRLR